MLVAPHGDPFPCRKPAETIMSELESLPDFLNFVLYCKTILVVNKRFRVFLPNPLTSEYR